MKALYNKILVCILASVFCVSCSQDVSAPTAELPTVVVPTLEFSAVEESAQIGGCIITVIDAFFRRDFMPPSDASQPGNRGPDGGTPLEGFIKFRIDNSAISAIELKFTVFVYDQARNGYPLIISRAYEDNTEHDWGGLLAAGDSQIITLVTEEGPYLRSKVVAVITWTDQSGNAVSVRTPELEIEISE